LRDEASQVDIVVPIYNALAFTRRCAESVLRHATGSFRLILVDDASTEPGMDALLAELGKSDRVSVLRNSVNVGFVATANRGMKESADADVLLLNSDTEVFEGFLDRLRAAAHRDPKTGIVSALSNNATILSVPVWLKDNPIPPPHDALSFAALIARASRREYPEIVTAVGSCMYIKREVLREVGFFDEQTFGRGFGEENDFCERARKAGYRSRLADDVFVWHKGKASFGEEGRVREAENLRLVERKHPGYLAAVQRFIGENPLARIQRRVRFRLDREKHRRSPATLFLLHRNPWARMPGGTEFHVLDLVRSLRLGRALIAYPGPRALSVTEVFDGDIRAAAWFSFPLESPVERFCIDSAEVASIVRRWIDLFDIRAAHVHHLLGWPITVLRALDEAGVPFVYSAHDYYAACPSMTLVDERGRPCDLDANGMWARSIPPSSIRAPSCALIERLSPMDWGGRGQSSSLPIGRVKCCYDRSRSSVPGSSRTVSSGQCRCSGSRPMACSAPR
jgi:O-antigen biosynthesis protein